jgi:beta-galactosidase
VNVKLGPHGLSIATESLPLYSGALHHFRLPRSAWQPALESLVALGARFVDTALPWNVHEKSPGVFDFGEDNPRLDIVAFIELAASVGLRAIVRLGPTLDIDLPFGGVPERVVWDEACMARIATGAPLLAASPPIVYPVPSPASRAYHDHAAVFLGAAAAGLAKVAAPSGPLALVIVGDETNLLGHGEGDHHPEVVAQYRRFLRHRYPSLGALRAAHHDGALASFDAVEAPRGAKDPERLGPHLDWAEMQEAALEAALYRYQSVLERHGLGAVVRLREEPAWTTAPGVDPRRVERVVAMTSFVCRAQASEAGRRATLRQVTYAAEHAAARKTVAFASRVRAGFPAAGAPRNDVEDLFVAMTALAYGARGIGLDMAVERDRWIGAPIDARGRARPSAAAWRGLFTGLTRVRHHELTRKAPVKIALPRNLERLGRLYLPGGGPLAGLAGAVSDARTDSDAAVSAVAEAEAFVATLETVLEGARIPYSFVPAESVERSLGDAAWTIFVCPGALAPNLVAAIGHHAAMSGAVSVGPRAPERDALFAAVSARLPALEHTAVPLLLPRGPATLSELVVTTATDLGVTPLPAAPDVVRTALHVDAAGRPRALFVLNPGEEPVTAEVEAPGISSACDATTGDDVRVTRGRLSLSVGPRTVRLLALAPTL